MKIAIGADHGGYALKEEIKQALETAGHHVEDLGAYTAEAIDYPDLATPVCRLVQDGQVDRGILICGTGIGMSIAANKHEGIRCALVHDVFSAKATREHNDTNVLSMGARVIGAGHALEIVVTWLGTAFPGGTRHVQRIGKVMAIEQMKVQP